MIYVSNEDQNEMLSHVNKIKDILNRYPDIDTKTSATTTICRTKNAVNRLGKWVEIINCDVNNF